MIKNSAHFAKKVFVHDHKDLNNEWIPKTPPTSSNFYFFSVNWTMPYTVDILINVSKHWNTKTSQNNVFCYRNYQYVEGAKPFDIILFTDDKKRIISAFPAAAKTYNDCISCN